jgi:hypothetical protein
MHNTTTFNPHSLLYEARAQTARESSKHKEKEDEFSSCSEFSEATDIA